MSKNNPVGTIPVEMPILTHMRNTIMDIVKETPWQGVSTDEIHCKL